MSITTKRGDEGTTELLFGVKVKKGAVQVEALGVVDELNAFLGFARVMVNGDLAVQIDRVQSWLVTLMGEVAMPEGFEEKYKKAGFGRVGIGEIDEVESWCEELERSEGGFRGWLRPGVEGGELAARLHMVRTVARRAERRVWDVDAAVASREMRVLLNRLSDWLWLVARSVE